jgi:hypothetical protein
LIGVVIVYGKHNHFGKKLSMALDTTYSQASSIVDAMVGVIGKDAPLAKRLRQLRDQMVLEASRGKRSPAGEK